MADPSCPMIRKEECFYLGCDCGVNHKENCTTYRLYVPKPYNPPEFFENIIINRIGSPISVLVNTLEEAGNETIY